MKKTLCLALALALALTLFPLRAAAAGETPARESAAAEDAYAVTPDAVAARIVRSPQALTVDGAATDCEKYNIDGRNYFRLRDLAQLLRGTQTQFNVEYDAERDAVVITTGLPYVSVGGELEEGPDRSASAVPTRQSVWTDGVERGGLSVWNIGGNNYFQLRELGALLGFGVDYDAATNTAMIESGGAADAQRQAWTALRQWVRRSYISLSEPDRDPVYWVRSAVTAGTWRCTGLTWDESEGALRLTWQGFTAVRGQYWVTLTLAPEGQLHRAAMLYYSVDSMFVTPFYGEAEIDAAALCADSIPEFERIEGWPADTPEAPRMGRLLRGALIEMLERAQTLLTEEAAPGCGWSVADFGFDPAILPKPSGALRPEPDMTLPLTLWSNDGSVYLGTLDRTSGDSVWNEHGLYGDPESPFSIMNREGRYGSETSDESAFNPYATHPPVIKDASGSFIGYLSTNEYLIGAYPLRDFVILLLEMGLWFDD